jgi:hypothetical protein
MKVAIIGSRSAVETDIEIIKKYLPSNTSQIVSGGAIGIDLLAKKYAFISGLSYKEFLPDYNDEKLKDKKQAPLIRNKKIVDYSDFVIAIWDGFSKGTAFTIDYCIKTYKPVRVYMLDSERAKL